MKYNVFLIVILLNIFSFTVTIYNVADKFQCDDKLPAETCYDTRTENMLEVAYVKKCGDGKICNEDFGNCEDEPKKLPFGAQCSTDSDCKSNTCLNNKCSYLSDGENCDNKNEKCGLNSYCKIASKNPTSYVCAKYKEKGEVCQDEYECKKGLVCATVGTETTSKCTKKYSVDDGVKTDKSEVCKSMEKYKNKDGTSEVCGYIKSTAACDNSNQCKVAFSAGGDFEKTEKCENSSNGYICSYETSIARDELALYVQEFSKRYDELSQRNDLKFSDLYYYTLDRNPDLVAKFVDYQYYKQINEGNDKECLRDFFNFIERGNAEQVMATNSSSLLKYTLYSVINILFML